MFKQLRSFHLLNVSSEFLIDKIADDADVFCYIFISASRLFFKSLKKAWYFIQFKFYFIIV
jgi:hypothetical protein